MYLVKLLNCFPQPLISWDLDLTSWGLWNHGFLRKGKRELFFIPIWQKHSKWKIETSDYLMTSLHSQIQFVSLALIAFTLSKVLIMTCLFMYICSGKEELEMWAQTFYLPMSMVFLTVNQYWAQMASWQLNLRFRFCRLCLLYCGKMPTWAFWWGC